jgi:hypothetical protein
MALRCSGSMLYGFPFFLIRQFLTLRKESKDKSLQSESNIKNSLQITKIIKGTGMI